MPDISDAEVKGFCDELKNFRENLSPAQKTLLDTILKIAWDTTTKEASLKHGFDGCFKPDEAALILAYHKGDVAMIPRMIRGVISGTGHEPDDQMIR